MDSTIKLVDIIYLALFSFVLVALAFLYRCLPNKKLISSLWKSKREVNASEYDIFVHQLSHALKWMSNNKVGALIVIEREQNLQKYVLLGYEIKAKLTSEFLITIFSNKQSALHDGGVIIRGYDIASISSYFPVTQTRLITTFGARHRASAGLTENTDAIAFVVSETTGRVSYSSKGELHEMNSSDIDSLSDEISKILNFYVS
ncbi:DisA bacterial checkpoint controller nucleotide-binding protein [Candidatus Mycoplasma haematohominis]|uniref:DisA bacterial checkpoint controller nucleotide-binding protein n=2 Tax=Candidatus Mycoplasma haematohominis TaxID=1494318 RepID=A0A478FQN3_9MOLU|nr:DisA bacterial checkpoint controller nucleotide-binding protein [Candidatus Mycoplasma haemohominis]